MSLKGRMAAAGNRGVPTGPRARIMVATPTYTGELHNQFVQSLMAALVHCLAHRVELELRIIAGASLIQYARNQLVREFLESDHTHILWIDADVGFDPRAVMRLLDHGKDVVGGVYPMKCNPVEWPYEPMPGEQSPGLHRAKIMPGGFLLCSRAAVQAAADRAPVYTHHMGGMQYETKHVFDVLLEGGVLLGEDVIFCRRVMEAGYDIWVDPDISFAHCGQFQWRGNLRTAIERSHADAPPLDAATVRSLATAAPAALAEPVGELFRAWGNSWAMPPAELVAVAALAKRSSMILEAGCGLSTIVAAAANPNARVHAIESDPEWTQRVIAECRRLGLANVTIHQVPLSRTDWCYEMPADLPAGPYGLAIVDGPAFLRGTGLERESDVRRAFYERFADQIEGATLVVDDIGEYRDIAARYQCEEIGGRFAVCVPRRAA